MKKIVLAGAFITLCWSFGANAGGAIVAGGKTNSAIVIYESKLDGVSRQLILNELGKQVAMGKISAYGTITDEHGNPAKCAQFGLLQTYNDSFNLLKAIADNAGESNAVVSVGRCSVGTID